MNIGRKIIKILDLKFSEDQLSNLSQEKLRSIRLVNYIAVISIANMLAYVLLYSILDFSLFKHASAFLTAASVLSTLIILINKAGKHLLAKLLLSVFTPAYMVYIAIIAFGTAPGFQVYLFVGAIIPLFLWERDQQQYPIILISSILSVYAMIEFFPPAYEPKIILPENYINAFRLSNALVCFSAVAIAIGASKMLHRQAEKQLLEQAEHLKLSQAHKDKVYSIIGHDLRAPLGSFSNLTDLFAAEYEDFTDEQRIQVIKSMHQSSLSVLDLLENLLDWSKMQSGTLTSEFKHHPLLAVAEESLKLYKDLIEKKNLTTEIKLNPATSVYVDHHMVSTIFRNLVSNAIKFTDEGGNISIEAKEAVSMIQVCVKDNGVGMSEEYIASLFDFQKAELLSDGGANRGSGLGLLLCKDFVEQHGGDIWIESQLNSGSSIYFTLPVSTDQAEN